MKILFNSFMKKNSDVLQPGQRLYKPRTDTGIGQNYCKGCANRTKIVFIVLTFWNRICLHVYGQEFFSITLSYLHFTESESDNPGALWNDNT